MRTVAVVSAALVGIVVVATALVFGGISAIAYLLSDPAPAAEDLMDPRPADLPFPGVDPVAVAVDTDRTVYVLDRSGRVLSLAEDADAPTELPFGTVLDGVDVAVRDGTVYVATGSQVLMLVPGASAPVVLPFGDIGRIDSITVDSDGTVYMAADATVLRLGAGDASATVVPLDGVTAPTDLAVNESGVLFLRDGNALVRQDPDGSTRRQPVSLPGCAPTALVPDSERVFVTCAEGALHSYSPFDYRFEEERMGGFGHADDIAYAGDYFYVLADGRVIRMIPYGLDS